MIFQVLGYLRGLTSPSLTTEDLMMQLYTSTSFLLLAMSLLVTGSTYLGESIICSLHSPIMYSDVIPKRMVDTYCYIHATYTVDDGPPYQVDTTLYSMQGLGEVTPTSGLTFHRYYQWVNLVMFLQAACFYLPRFLWRRFENGILGHLQQELNNPLQLQEGKSDQLRKVVHYLSVSEVSHRLYGRRYMLVYIIALANLVAQFFFTDHFLNYEFLSYARRVLEEGSIHQDRVFPKQAKCSLYRYGGSGTLQNYDAICLLPLNILNEKLYLILYVWMVLLLVGTLSTFIYWLLHWVSPGLRRRHLEYHLKGRIRLRNEEAFRNCNKHFGKWLLLHLLRLNIDRRSFQEIINRLCSNKATGLHRTLTNISEDFNETPTPQPLASPGDPSEEENQNQFFLPGNVATRKSAVTFKNEEDLPK